MSANKPKKSWVDKIANSKGLPKIVKKGSKKMIVPSPKDVENIMKKVRKGRIITINNITHALSKKYKADTCCPLTTGIFVWISANASYEDLLDGKKTCTPYWRTIKSDGTLNAKYPGGELAHAKLLIKEGHKMTKKGTRIMVAGFENKIQKL